MSNEREPGATFAPGDIGWIDFESKCEIPIEDGTDRYSRDAQAVILSWAIGDGPVNVEAVADFPRKLRWQDMPVQLRDFHERVARGEAVYCAHHSGFDRFIWNYATTDFPWMYPDDIIDTKVQATASGLPADLETSAKYAANAVKRASGKDLIKLFCLPGCTATPLTHPAEWTEFKLYAGDDIHAMRDLFRHTRQLPMAEWREFWAAETINERGIGIDVDMVTHAAKLAAEDARRSAKELDALTSGAVTTVNQVKRMAAWLKLVLPPAGADILVKREEEKNEDGEITKPGKDSLTRNQVIRLLAFLMDRTDITQPMERAQRVLEIRLYGGSKTPAKFKRMVASHVGGVIRQQYVFGGAAQTGRFSAKGIQIHNLARDPLPYEMDALDGLADGVSYDDFSAIGDFTPVSRKLSLLIRPSLVPQPGKAFCWGDWSNIEARLTPWLANSRESMQRLEIFEAVDRGEEKYDVYVRTAASLSRLELHEVTEKIRQRGKVVELACGFGGGRGALLAMAASYGMNLGDDEAGDAVLKWRLDNPWAPEFWGKHDEKSGSYGLWGAACSAMESPGNFYPVGRVGYIYLRDYLGGSLLCQLPSGRFLTYRKIKWEMVDELDDDDNVIGTRRELRCAKGRGRMKLWPGLFCENVVQAAAADLLRGTLVRLEEPDFSWMPVRLDTHDEILVECDEKDAAEAADWLTSEMIRGFDWTRDLPIAADAKIGRWYSKSKLSVGL